MKKKHTFVLFLAAVLPVLGNLLVNPSLESADDGTLPGWTPFGTTKFTIDHTVVHSGKAAVCCQTDNINQSTGLKQTVTFDNPDQMPIIFSGWSKAEAVSHNRDYDIHLDIYYADGTNAWGRCAFWPVGTHDWQYTCAVFRPDKPVAKIEYYVLLRHVTGKAWFDDFELLRQEPDTQISHVTIRSLAPFSHCGLNITGSTLARNTTYTAVLRDANGTALARTSGKGPIIHWAAPLKTFATTLDMTVTCGDISRTTSYPVPRETLTLPANPVQTPFQIWTADSMTFVSPLTYPTAATPAPAINLELAGTERESAQILITAGPQPLTQANLALPQLTDKQGRPFKGTLKWERVGYIPRTETDYMHPDGFPNSETWLPDPLLPAQPFSVPANATQALWLTAYADRNAAPGTYTGNATVTIGSQSVAVPISVTVFPFALPETFSFPTAFCLMDGFLFHVYPDGDRDATRRYAWDILLDHRLNPDDISRTSPPRLDDLLHARSRGMNRFNVLNLVPKPTGNPLWVCYSQASVYTPDFLQSLIDRLKPIVAELRQHDLLKYAYVYGFDERSEDYYPIMNDLHALLKKNFPELAFMTTSHMYLDLTKKPERLDCYGNDWYCPLTFTYNDELSAKLRAKGHQVWWYTSCSPQHPYANFSNIEYPAIEARIIAWQSFQHHADGFLFWHVNLWKTPARLNDSDCYFPDFRLPGAPGVVGDGHFLYPGSQHPLPSIRLANLRDGSEDYDYLTLLGSQSYDFCNRLSPSLTEFSRDPAFLRQLRHDIARRLTAKQP